MRVIEQNNPNSILNQVFVYHAVYHPKRNDFNLAADQQFLNHFYLQVCFTSQMDGNNDDSYIRTEKK